MSEKMIRTFAEIATAVGATALMIYGWLRLRRRSWSVSNRDEAMRRHINQHYS
jgi:hypothetical protein